MKMCHPPPNHDLGRVMASCALRTHLKGLLNINLVVLVVLLLLDGENFLVREEVVLCPFSACHWRRHFALVRRISFKAGVRRCPFERRCALMCRSSLMRHGLIGSICSAFGTWSSVSRADFSESAPILFCSGFNPHTFQVSWTSLVFNPPDFLILFNCWIDEHSRNFQSF